MVLRILNDYILSESYYETIDQSYDKLAARIGSECSKWLQECQGEMAYRGTDSHNMAQIFQGKPRQNRQPRDATLDFQNKLDDVLFDNGFSALRGNSIFVTGNEGLAVDFGSVYVIFPANGYNYTWNIKYKDLIDLFDDITNRIDLLDIDEDDLTKMKRRAEERAEESLQKSGFSATSGSMYKFNQYRMYLSLELRNYTMDRGEPSYSKEKLEKEVLDTFHKDELADALYSGHEVYLTCEYYYAINLTVFESNIRDRLNKYSPHLIKRSSA